MKLAQAQMMTGDPAAGLITLKSWVDQNSGSNSTRMLLGAYYVRFNRLLEAREQFAELARREPNDWVAHNELAVVLLKMGKAGDAVAPAERALELSRSNPIVMDTAGLVAMATRNPPRALTLFENAARLAPNNRDIAVNLARALSETGQRERAIEVLRDALGENAAFDSRKDAEALLKQLGE